MSSESRASTPPVSTEGIGRLGDEVVRFTRLGVRIRSMLCQGEPGAESSAVMLLFPLLHMGPLRVTALAELKQADVSTVSRQVTQLVKAGLAHRQADPVDRRAYRLAITPEGEAVCRRVQAARGKLLDRALHAWPADQVALFADLFQDFNTAVETHLRADTAAGGPSDTAASDTSTPREIA